MLRLSQHANILIRPIRAVVFIVEHSAETMQQAVQRSTWCMKNPGRCHFTYSLPKSSVTLVLRDNRTMYDFEGPPVRDPLFKNNRHRCVQLFVAIDHYICYMLFIFISSTKSALQHATSYIVCWVQRVPYAVYRASCNVPNALHHVAYASSLYHVSYGRRQVVYIYIYIYYRERYRYRHIYIYIYRSSRIMYKATLSGPDLGKAR